MREEKAMKQKIAYFGRNLTALLNRATMYHADHPYTEQSIEAVYTALLPIIDSRSPLVFNMNREQLFIDEDPLDSYPGIKHVVETFKRLGIQSISLYKGLSKSELRTFTELFSSTKTYPDAEAMKKALTIKGIGHLKINHVLFKKVTAEEEVISRDALKKAMPQMMDDDQQHRSKRLLIDSLLESVLTDEFVKTISINTRM
jgi:hypothetical protein